MEMSVLVLAALTALVVCDAVSIKEALGIEATQKEIEEALMLLEKLDAMYGHMSRPRFGRSVQAEASGEVDRDLSAEQNKYDLLKIARLMNMLKMIRFYNNIIAIDKNLYDQIKKQDRLLQGF